MIAAGLVLLAVVTIVVTALVTRRLIARTVAEAVEEMRARTEERDKALYQIGKAHAKSEARVTAAAGKAVAEARRTQKEIQKVLCDPAVQKVINGG